MVAQTKAMNHQDIAHRSNIDFDHIDAKHREAIARSVLEGSVAPQGQVTEQRSLIALSRMGIQPAPVAPVIPAIVRPQLIQRHSQLAQLANANQLPFEFLGYAHAFGGTRIYRGQGTDWALMNLTEDPLYLSAGNRLLAPRRVSADLKALVKAGIDCDAIYIAHEIPAGLVQSGQPVPMELITPPPPLHMSRRVSQLSRLVDGIWRLISASASTAANGALRGAHTTTALAMQAGTYAGGVAADAASIAVRTVGTAAVATATATATAASRLAGIASFAIAIAALDPVLLGVNLDWSRTYKGQPMGMWYYLSHWNWL